MDNSQNFLSVCRLCMSNNRPLISILDCNHLAQKIQVYETDRVSSICMQCISKVEEWFEFKNFCEDIQVKLNVWVNNAVTLNTEIKIEETENVYDPNIICIKSEPLDTYNYRNDEENDEAWGPSTSHSHATSNAEQESLLVPTRECTYAERPYAFENIARLKNKNLISGNKHKYKTACKYCMKKFKSIASCHRHERNIHVQLMKKQINDNSQKIITEKEFVMQHSQIYDMLRKRICDCCNKLHRSRKCLLAHLRQRMHIASYTCFLCCISFPNQSQYIKHKKWKSCLDRVKLLEDPDCIFKVYEHYRCVKCNKIYVLKCHLLKHLITKHQPEVYPSHCSKCNVQYMNNDDFYRHIDQHACNYQIYCSICKENFNSSHVFKTHAVTHESDSENFEDETLRIVNPFSEQMNKLKMIPCLMCGNAFTTEINLKRHLAMKHRECRYFPCTQCFALFTTVKQLCSHMDCCPMNINEHYSNTNELNVQNRDNYVTCEMCQQSYPSTEIDEHDCKHFKLKLKLYRCSDSNSYKATTTFTPQSYRCTLCNLSIGNRKEYNEHMVKHGKSIKNNSIRVNGMYKCPYCEKIYRTYSSMYKHKSVKHSYKSKKMSNGKMCDVCKKNFPHADALICHKKLAHSIPDVIVSKIDKNKINFQNAISKSNKLECDKCNKKFTSFKALRNHICHYHLFKCSNCPKSFSQSIALKLHSKIHGNPDAYRCDICFRNTTTASALVNHMKIHSLGTGKSVSLKTKKEIVVQTNHQCRYCHKGFTNARYLKLHANLHKICKLKYRNELELINKPIHSCDLCNKQFSLLGSLNKHLKYHVKNNAQSNLKCLECNKSFSSAAALCGHKGWHKRTTNISLKISTTRTVPEMTVKKNLQKQVQRLKKIKLNTNFLKKKTKNLIMEGGYKCIQCEALFNSAKKLRSHILRHHTKGN